MAKPLHEIRVGLIVARIWRRRIAGNNRYTISVVRLFRDGELWKQSTRFGQRDIPVVRLILDQAYERILLEGKSNNNNNSNHRFSN